MPAPCLTKWPTNSGEVVYPTNTKPDWGLSICGSADALRRQQEQAYKRWCEMG
jgi:hypothetical protein